MSQSTPFEVEQKFAVPELAAIRLQLEDFGATLAREVRQVDRYFNHPARDFAQTDEALRIRSIGTTNFVTWKGPKIDSRTKTRHEIETPLGDGEHTAQQFGETLEALGFRSVATVSKLRQCFDLTREGFEFEVALDDVDSVGTYVEIELITDESGLLAAQNAVVNLGEKLGLTDPERRSYLELLLEQ